MSVSSTTGTVPGGQPLPGLCEAGDGDITQADDDGEEGVEILVFFTAVREKKIKKNPIKTHAEEIFAVG